MTAPKSLDGHPTPVGVGAFEVLDDTGSGRVLVMDSMLFVAQPSVHVDDVVVAASFCGAGGVNRALRQGVRAVISHDGGVGKDEAGISGLPFGDRWGMPVAAVEGLSAEVANGRSLGEGRISHANKLATALGVRAGQPVREAAILLMSAPLGRSRDGSVDVDDTVHVVETLPTGRILAARAHTSLEPGDYTNDVISVGVHSGWVWKDLVAKLPVKGWIANDAGMGLHDTGIGGLEAVDAWSMPAASVDTMTARLDDGLSTWNDGIVSAANHTARAAGVQVGMRADQALRLMSATPRRGPLSGSSEHAIPSDEPSTNQPLPGSFRESRKGSNS